MITSEDLDRLMRAVEGEAHAFLTGRFGTDTGFTQADDMTIFGPFGGPAPNMPPWELMALQQAASKQFEVGETTLETVKRIVSDELGVLVMLGRNRARTERATL